MTAPLVELALPDVDTAGLRRMKRNVTGLLVVVAVVYLVSFALPDTTATGFLRAAAEAGMVGGLADWFAVTALFRHPLGLRIPHTALVPRQKDQLATKLGEFVTGNFLTPAAVTEQVAEAHVVRRAAERLADPATSASLARELTTVGAAVVGSLDPRNVTDYLLELVRRDLGRRSYTPVLGRFLARAVEGQGQQPLVDVGVHRARRYLVENRDALRPQVKDFIEEQGWLGWLVATDKRVDRALDSAIATLTAVEHDQDHPLRHWVDGLLTSFADDLRYSPATALALDARLRELVEDPALQALVHDVVADGVESVRASLADGGSALHDRVAQLVRDLGQRVLGDAGLEQRLERGLQDGVRYAVEHYGDTVVELIQKTVRGWEARDASARIESAVGRDLQFIRINGTVVGALAGVAIHVVAVALG